MPGPKQSLPDTWVRLLREKARLEPRRNIFTFLDRGEMEAGTLDYGALDLRARTVAALLQGSGLAGKRLLLVYPEGLEFIAGFFGCLYAGSVAVPVPYPDPVMLKRLLPRLTAVIADSGAAALLTVESGLPALESPELWGDIRRIATDSLPPSLAEEWAEPEPRPSTLAMLQYTSGSIAAPKGVMITHENLLANNRIVIKALGATKDCVAVHWLPFYHDMGLGLSMLAPLYVGCRSLLMSPLSFAQRPARWLRAISRYGATHAAAPSFAYDLCVDRVKENELAELKLGSWEAAGNSSDFVRSDVMDRFADRFGTYGFRKEAFVPGYGLAEATMAVSLKGKGSAPTSLSLRRTALERERRLLPAEGSDRRVLVGCGPVWPDTRVLIVDPSSLRQAPSDQAGEIWLAGPSVAQGYWNRPRETEETFKARLAGTDEGPFLRTGDLGFLRDGELFVTGRIKDLIIIHGINRYPEDIEKTAGESHDLLSPAGCAAFGVEMEGSEQLVVVAELERRPLKSRKTSSVDLEAVREAVRGAVNEAHQVQVHAVVLVRPGDIPRTASGKLRRSACRQAYLARSLSLVDK